MLYILCAFRSQKRKKKSKENARDIGHRPQPVSLSNSVSLHFFFFPYTHHSSWPRQQEFLKITPQQLYRGKMSLYWAVQAMSHNSPMRTFIGISSQVSGKASGQNLIINSRLRNSKCRASRDLDCKTIRNNSEDQETNKIQQLAALVWQGVLSVPLSLFTPHPVRR